MSKLVDINVVVRNQYGDCMSITTPVSVTKDGMFTTTLPESAVSKLREYGLELEKNRVGRDGFFAAKTLDDLRREVREFAEEALSRELVQEESVIKYQVITAGSCYIDDDGEILPNGGWCKQKNYDDKNKKGHWANFTEVSDSCHPVTPTLMVWVGVYDRKRYRFKSGKEITELKRKLVDSNRDQRTNLNWLCDQVSVRPYNAYRGDVSPFPEVPATEENAAFFVTLLKFVYKANQLLTNFVDSKNILSFIEGKRPLGLPGFVDNQREE